MNSGTIGPRSAFDAQDSGVECSVVRLLTAGAHVLQELHHRRRRNQRLEGTRQDSALGLLSCRKHLCECSTCDFSSVLGPVRSAGLHPATPADDSGAAPAAAVRDAPRCRRPTLRRSK